MFTVALHSVNFNLQWMLNICEHLILNCFANFCFLLHAASVLSALKIMVMSE